MRVGLHESMYNRHETVHHEKAHDMDRQVRHIVEPLSGTSETSRVYKRPLYHFRNAGTDDQRAALLLVRISGSNTEARESAKRRTNPSPANVCSTYQNQYNRIGPLPRKYHTTVIVRVRKDFEGLRESSSSNNKDSPWPSLLHSNDPTFSLHLRSEPSHGPDLSIK